MIWWEVIEGEIGQMMPTNGLGPWEALTSCSSDSWDPKSNKQTGGTGTGQYVRDLLAKQSKWFDKIQREAANHGVNNWPTPGLKKILPTGMDLQKLECSLRPPWCTPMQVSRRKIGQKKNEVCLQQIWSKATCESSLRAENWFRLEKNNFKVV